MSTREPKRISPYVSPAATSAPGRTSQTIRLASRPAIWTTPIRAPPSTSSSRALRSLSSLAFSRSADRKRPGRYSTASTRPSAGIRCTCTSSTDRNTLTRGTGTGGRSSSGGGGTSAMVATVPSAAESTAPTQGGGTRRGSRKKAAVAAVARAPATPPRPVSARTNPAVAATPATMGRPPGCIGGMAARTSPMTCGREKPEGDGAARGETDDAAGSGIGVSRLLRVATRRAAAGGGYGTPDKRRPGHKGRCTRGRTQGPAPQGARTQRGPGHKGPGPSSPETTTPAVEPLVRSPATGGGLFVVRPGLRVVRQVSPSLRSIVQITSGGSS